MHVCQEGMHAQAWQMPIHQYVDNLKVADDRNPDHLEQQAWLTDLPLSLVHSKLEAHIKCVNTEIAKSINTHLCRYELVAES